MMMTRRYALIPILFAIVTSGSILIAIVLRIHRSGPTESLDPGYQQFMQWIADGRTTEALELGDSLFSALLQEKPDDSALVLLARRLDVAKRIRALVADHVQPSRPVLMEGIAGIDNLGLPAPAAPSKHGEEMLLPPAREVYWTHLGAFTTELTSERLTKQQVTFYRQYYELRMQDSIMAIGRQIVVTNPDSSEHVCQAIVLPLLYLHERDDAWDQMGPLLTLFAPEMLDILSMFALLQVERPEAATALARYKARAMGKEFFPTRWACDAADACATNHRPDLAEKLLRTVITGVKDGDAVVELRLKIADAYARCADYVAAGHVCEGILADLPDTSLYGRVVAVHLGYLAKDDNAERVTIMTASVLEDPRCGPYLGQILYLRWWALQKANRSEEAAQIAQRLLEQYPDSSCAAPVLLERATDALARQQYDKCRELLVRLTRDFAGTESAKRARDILARLQGSATEWMKQ